MNFFKVNLNKFTENGKSNKTEIKDGILCGLRNHEIKYGFNVDILSWSKAKAKIS